MGDESLVEAIIHDLISTFNDPRITVLAWDRNRFLASHQGFPYNNKFSSGQAFFLPSQFKNPENIFSIIRSCWSIATCDIFIWGGGGIIRNHAFWLKAYLYPLRLAQFFKKPIIIWSIGVDEITNPTVIKFINKIKRANFLSVRDFKSKINFLKVNNNFPEEKVHVIRDPALHLVDLYRFDRNKINEVPKLGINFSFWKADLSDKERAIKFTTAVAGALDSAHKKVKFTISYLPTVPGQDKVFFEMMRGQMKSIIDISYPNVNSPAKYLKELSYLDIFLGMRYHSIILASNIKKLPIAGVIYDEKVVTLKEEGNLKNLWSIDEIIEKPDLLEEWICRNLNQPRIDENNFDKFIEESRIVKEFLASI